MAFAREMGFGALAERGVAAAESIRPDVVYAGFSFGVMVAQQLAQTRPGARGAVLMSACVPVSEFGNAWPQGVPVHVHGKDADPFFAEDLEAAQALVGSTDRAELFLYRGKTPLRRLLAPGVRRRRCDVADRSRAGLPQRDRGRQTRR